MCFVSEQRANLEKKAKTSLFLAMYGLLGNRVRFLTTNKADFYASDDNVCNYTAIILHIQCMYCSHKMSYIFHIYSQMFYPWLSIIKAPTLQENNNTFRLHLWASNLKISDFTEFLINKGVFKTKVLFDRQAQLNSCVHFAEKMQKERCEYIPGCEDRVSMDCTSCRVS